MFVAESLLTQLTPFIYKTIVGLIFTGLLGVIMWPFTKARAEWTALKSDLASTHAELVAQRTNCLATLQTQGATQIEILGKAVAALDGVRLDLAEQTGYLKSAFSQPPSRRRIAKK
jgi:hypothetical protein